jgi:hypothetical protein
MSNYDRQNTWLSLQPITGVKFSDGTTQTTAHSSDDATPEGEAVKSTTNSNETSGKVLTADGDGTSSWQAPSTGSHHHYITRSTMGSGTATTAATSVSISSEVAAAAASTGWTPSVAIIELYADITRSPTGAEHLILKVGDDSSMSHYAHVEARLYSGSRDDAAATASPTNQATVPIGGSAGSEVLYHSAAKSSGGTASWKWDLVGFVK